MKNINATNVTSNHKPEGCGYIDESWFVGRAEDGRWAAWSDAVDQDPEYFATEEEAVGYWRNVATQYGA